MRRRRPVLCLLFSALAADALAFNPPVAVEGPLRVEIKAPDTLRTLGKPFETEISLENSGARPLVADVAVWVIDDWRIEPEGKRRVERSVHLAPNSKERLVLRIVAGRGTYNAHYPIHARASFALAGSRERREAHAVKILLVDSPRPARAGAPPTTGPVAIAAGTTALSSLRSQRVFIRLGDEGSTRLLGAGWLGADPATGGHFAIGSADRGARRPCFVVHPPWRKGWGTIWADYDLVLPETTPIVLRFATAIRDHDPKREPPSDGAEFRVLAVPRGGSPNLLFRHFTKAKKWEDAVVDLSRFASERVTLRLWIGPGPAHNTACDLGYWGRPLLVVGRHVRSEPEAARAQRFRKALALARAARRGSAAPWSWRLESDAGTFGVAVVPGPLGAADAAVALSGEKGALCFEGFRVEINKTAVADIPLVGGKEGWAAVFSGGRGRIEARLLCGGREVRVREEVWAEGGALRFRFSMPGVERDKRGRPRFTLLGLGRALLPAAQPTPFRPARARRVYAGFGNVIENPGRFDLHPSGFDLSTRHVGVDFDNGLSAVQCCDIFPDRFRVVPKSGLYSLQTHHDATLSLIPSEKGAFAAARVYREQIAGFQAAPGVKRLQGRMCLDYWRPDYRRGIRAVERLARYGVTDCVFVWHNWQRWGYDYRLPEIYPARTSHTDFVRLAETCRRHGILFAPHDNYIDFYPDAEGFSYDHIIFNRDGTPQRAWYNRERGAQSYRWLPCAFRPWLERNVALLGRDVRPTAYFIDVFSAIAPMDYYDRSGRFHPKTETIRCWGETFDYVRRAFGGAPQISEAGHDALIGHLDAGESDHKSVALGGSRQWAWNIPCADAERTPWHDMASHGSLVLFAGGLAGRYAGGLDQGAHGYGSDDYLSLTVLGGRNPMASGEARPETVSTYWLLHDVCAELGRRPMLSHEFAGGDIHRQIVRFGGEAAVYVNRGKDDWHIGDLVLPRYGFSAKAGDARADVSRRDGLVTAYAESPRAIFADARPPLAGRKIAPELSGRVNTERRVVDFGPVATNGALHLLRSGEGKTWKILFLPGCPACEVRLRPDLIGRRKRVETVAIERIGKDGEPAGKVEFARRAEWVVFKASPMRDFGYIVKIR